METGFEGSNIALLGSEIDHHLKSISAHTEPAWSATGISTSAGIWCWTVIDFKLVLWKGGPGEVDLNSGDFREGDSYLLLLSIAPVPSKPDVLLHSIYFWLGSKTSQDESGVAAYKAVELGEFLGNHPHQSRQTQGKESQNFLSLFRPHFLVTLGGHKSGFHHVSPSTPASLHLTSPRLWEISLPLSDKGIRKQLKVQEVEANKESIKRGSCYILDRGDILEQWNGNSAHPLLKAKGAELSRNWVDSREGKATLKVFDDGDDDKFFFDLGMPISDLPLQFPHSYSPASTPAISSAQAYSLLESSSFPTKLTVNSLTPTSLMLIITISRNAYYIFVGSKVELEKSRSAMMLGQRVLSGLIEKGRASNGRELIRVVEGKEGEQFFSSIM